jgi:hypothetical protein
MYHLVRFTHSLPRLRREIRGVVAGENVGNNVKSYALVVGENTNKGSQFY